MHKLNYDNCITLLHLIRRGQMTFDMCTEWALNQYTDIGIDPQIEAIALAYDLDDLIEIVRDFAAHKMESDRHNIGIEFLLGEVYALSLNIGFSHLVRDATRRIVDRFGENLPLPDITRKLILDSIDYHNIYGWHETPKYEHLNNAEYRHMDQQLEKVTSYCKQHYQTYLDTVKIFGITK